MSPEIESTIGNGLANGRRSSLKIISTMMGLFPFSCRTQAKFAALLTAVQNLEY